MTEERANEIARIVIYRHIDRIMEYLEECENTNVIFNVGKRLGMMQNDLEKELEKEIKEQK